MFGAPPLELSDQLQIGIELEFVAPRNTKWETEHFPIIRNPYDRISMSQDACRHHLAEQLHATGLDAAYHFKTPDWIEHQPLRQAAPPGSIVLGGAVRILGDPARYAAAANTSNDANDGDKRDALYRYWVLKEERSLTYEPQFRSWIQTELNSPITAENEAYQSSFVSLGTAIGALYHAYAESPPHMSMSQCGLHVHLSPTFGATVPYTQRILTLVVVLERALLLPLCHPARRDGIMPFLTTAEIDPSDDVIMRYKTNVKLDVHARAHVPAALVAAEGPVIAAIWSARDYHKLRHIAEYPFREPGKMFGIMCKRKFSWPTVTADDDTSLGRTIEFRHAQSSFSVRFVHNWVKLVLAIGRVGLLPPAQYKNAVDTLHKAASIKGTEEEVCMATLRALAAEAERAQFPGRLDFGFWRERYRDMEAGFDNDVDGEGKVRLDTVFNY